MHACQGLRPELPNNAHPKLLEMMQRCWEAVPGNRPSFSEIKAELEELLHEVDIKEVRGVYIIYALLLSCVEEIKVNSLNFPWCFMSQDDTEAPNGSWMHSIEIPLTLYFDSNWPAKVCSLKCVKVFYFILFFSEFWKAKVKVNSNITSERTIIEGIARCFCFTIALQLLLSVENCTVCK